MVKFDKRKKKVENNVINWLLEDKNPIIAYRTKKELLEEKSKKMDVNNWLDNFLPNDWQDTKGLWLTYYYTTIAECGLNRNDIKIDKNKIQNRFKDIPIKYGCEDFMLLRALIMLGFFDEVKNILKNSKNNQLPDGGFLCLHRRHKNPLKSCIKSNNVILMFCAECKKRQINYFFEADIVSYFWKHNIFYKTKDLSTLVLDAKKGWRTIDTFYPFDTMRIGLQNIVESFCALGYGYDNRLNEAWEILSTKRDVEGKYILDGTLSKSYLPKEKIGEPSKWVTFYSLLAEKNRKTKKN
jgi:hypothetical protein